MREWPPIEDPALRERLALDDDQFFAALRELAAAWGGREYKPEALGRALSYPWERPARSFLLRGRDVELLEELQPASREAVVAEFRRGRHPILAFGANGSPTGLARKFAHFEDEADRTALVFSGDLHEHDVGASASPTLFGYMPATLFASPGTAVRASVSWLTPAQLTQLTWSELSYRLGRLDAATFSPDDDDVEVSQIFAFVSRFGAFCLDGGPVALAAVPARGRTAPALSQRELLDVVAGLIQGQGARCEDLVRAIFDDMAAVVEAASQSVWPASVPLQSAWTPFPA
jgi:hypothetical protein